MRVAFDLKGVSPQEHNVDLDADEFIDESFPTPALPPDRQAPPRRDGHVTAAYGAHDRRKNT